MKSRLLSNAACFVAAALSACASADTVATPIDSGPVQPRMATYSCADGATIAVENRGASVHLVGPNGEGVTLPASPATQRSRYGEGSDAIVIEGREALFMRGGEEPLSCSR